MFTGYKSNRLYLARLHLPGFCIKRSENWELKASRLPQPMPHLIKKREDWPGLLEQSWRAIERNYNYDEATLRQHFSFHYSRQAERKTKAMRETSGWVHNRESIRTFSFCIFAFTSDDALCDTAAFPPGLGATRNRRKRRDIKPEEKTTGDDAFGNLSRLFNQTN